MTTVKSTDINYNDNALDLSTGLSETEEIKKAIEQAESAMAAPAAAKPLAPAKKAAKRGGKAGRIVGISKDENEFIQELLNLVSDDPEYGTSHPIHAKIASRFGK